LKEKAELVGVEGHSSRKERRRRRKGSASFALWRQQPLAHQQKVGGRGAVRKERRAVQVVVDCQLLLAGPQVGQKRRLLAAQAPPLAELVGLFSLVRGLRPSL
jgi:hypothetical protein